MPREYRRALSLGLAVLATVVAVSARGWSAEPAAVTDAEFTEQIQPLLQKYCLRCHGAEKREGNFDLRKYPSRVHVQHDRKAWQKALHVVREAEMPPQDPLPSAAERQQLVTWLERAMAIDWSKVKDPGHVALPRLTREEYNNTLRDLIGVDLRPADDFSEDGEGLSGFNTDRDNLFLTPALFEKYLLAAQRTLDGAIALESEPQRTHFESEAMFMTERSEKPRDFGDGFAGYVLNRGQMTLYESVRFPEDGYYRFRVRGRFVGGPTGAALRIDDLLVGTLGIDTATPQEYELICFVRRGGRQMAWNVAPFPGKPKADGADKAVASEEPAPAPSSSAPPVKPADAPDKPAGQDEKKKDAKPAKPAAKAKPAAGAKGSPALDWIEVIGPIRPHSAAATSPVFFVEPSESLSRDAAAELIIARFARRAFRRPVAQEEVARYLSLYRRGTTAGEAFLPAVELALVAILTSPHFLYRVELGPVDAEHRLDDYQLASRLSYFLWMSMPDDALFELAAAGRLHEPAVLDAQIERMLQDPKLRASSRAFLGQWLGFAALGHSVQPDPKRFPSFTPELCEAMKAETYLCWESLLREPGSLLQLLDADYTFVNRDLARHYGLPLRAISAPSPTRCSA